MEKILNFIGGEWRPAATGRFAKDLNPANTDEVLAEAALSDVTDLHAAVAAAKAAYPGWKSTPAPRRGEILFRAVEIMRRRHEELARVLTREEGKIFSEAKGEVQRAINILEYCAGEGRRQYGDAVQSELPLNFCWTQREPYGVAAIVTPWNFPVAIPVWKVAPALVTGNTVVFKPASLTPFTARIVTEIFAEAGIPKGVLNLILGSGAMVGDHLVTHPDVKVVSFTGSNEVGLRLYEQGAKHHKKVQCEMGGKNALVVFADADLELAVAGTVGGAFGSTGQRCTATSRAIVHADLFEAYVDKVCAAAERYVVGDGMNSATQMGPCVDASQMKTVTDGIARALADGAKLRCGGGRLATGAHAKGFFLQPTLFTHVAPDSFLAQEELFGPVLAVLPFRTYDEAMALANNSAFGLTSSAYTNDVGTMMRFCADIETGITHINSPTIGGEAHLPFGGMKATGVGEREVGRTAIEFYSQWKTVYVDYTGARRTSNVY